MSAIWIFLISISIFTALLNGTMETVSNSILQSTSDAINLTIHLSGAICLWSGFLNVMKDSKILDNLASILRPLIKILIGKSNSVKKSETAIAANLVANLMGQSNASLPFGLKAVKQLHCESKDKDSVADEIISFVVLNTLSFQIIPTTIIMVRLQSGSQKPMIILPAVWICSIISVITAVLMTKICKLLFRGK